MMTIAGGLVFGWLGICVVRAIVDTIRVGPSGW